MVDLAIGRVGGRPGARMALAAVTVAFGLQLWRALVPLLVNVLRNRFDWSAAVVGPLALAVFLTGFLAGPLQRRLGRQRALVLAAGGTGLLRLAMQLWTEDPAWELGLALAGGAFFAVAATLLASGSGREDKGNRLAAGVLLGLALDLGLHGLWRTYDLNWQSDVGALAVTGSLFAAQVGLLAQSGKRVQESEAVDASEAAWSWLVLGPFLVLALLATQNVARLTVMTGWTQATAFLWMAGTHALALAGVIWLVRRRRPSGQAAAFAGLALLFVGLVPAWPAGIWTAIGYLLMQSGAAVALAMMLRGQATSGGLGRVRPVALVQGATALLFAALITLYHFQYSNPSAASPFAGRLLPLLPTLLLSIAALGVAGRVRGGSAGVTLSWRPALLATALLALPLYRMATVERPAEQAEGFPLRVMTYNLHAGFDTEGHLGLEALAAVIEAQEPDVVMLQEVSRGLVIYGGSDMLAWLAQRLGMHAHFAPTADALWGLATLSKAPILEGGGAALPPAKLFIRRGMEWVTVEVGSDDRLTVVNNHFHHPGMDGDVRVVQAQAVVERWRETALLVVGGDLNARPETAEIGLFLEAGWQDVVGVYGPRPGYTFSSTDLHERIDYLWLSPDLEAAAVSVPFSTASDHLPVAATIRRADEE